MDRATRKRLFNLCDPNEPLPAGDARYVDISALGARGTFRSDEIARRIELSDRPVVELLTAPPGAGITTELLRLEDRLRRDANLLTVHIEAESAIHLFSPIDAADILLTIVERTERAVAEAGGRAPSRNAMRRSRRWLTTAELDARPEPTLDLLGDSPLRAKVRADAHANRSTFVAEIQDGLTLLDDEARKLGHEGIAVFFDGLEKLRGVNAESLDHVLRSAERLFTLGSPLMGLPVHAVYTLPLALLLRAREAVRVLPMIALADRRGHPHADGICAARALIARRIPEPDQDTLFGAANRVQRLDQLVAASGGSPRDILRMLTACIAETSLDERRLSQILALPAELYGRAIRTRDAPWLARVHVTKALDVEGETERETAERALSNGEVLAYQSDRAWFDLHPAVAGAPALVHELERARARV